MLKFFSAKNLSSKDVVETHPWEFDPGADVLNRIRAMRKPARREYMLRPDVQWCCYSPIRALAGSQRIAADNPPIGDRGAVVDYDSRTELSAIQAAISALPGDFQPQFVELSLSLKVRLVWVFERELLLPSSEFAQEFLRAFFKTVGAPTLLAGYDKASEKPTELWTNGGEWYLVKPEPVPNAITFGILTEVSKKASLFGREEVPLTTIAEEVQKRFPGRWGGEFKESATGVRFWDQTADCPTGCQVKPDGMLCFTGNVPFMRWADILGREWVDNQRVLQLGKAAEDVYFDGRNYWQFIAEKWRLKTRQDVTLALKNRGLSDKAPRGATISDADRVLSFIQDSNIVEGAAPLINYPPGLANVRGDRVLNTLRLQRFEPVAGATGDPQQDFPWIWDFLNSFLARPDNLATDSLVAWTARFYRALLNHERRMGQTVFIAGPKNSGKTLFCLHILQPLFGNRTANPYKYMVGEDSFNDELFESAFWAINDEESPRTEAARQSFIAKLKGFVVNPIHTYHPKFCKKVQVDWIGRIFITLNDDPASVGILPEKNDNTADKMMFFASQPYHAEHFPGNVEEIIAKELPYFAHWLLHGYQPPAEILSQDRCGIVSYYDPVILSLSAQQQYAYNLTELLGLWIGWSVYWTNPDTGEWRGTPSGLMSDLSMTPPVAALLRDWGVPKLAKALTTLARAANSGVEFIAESGEREFRVVRNLVLKK